MTTPAHTIDSDELLAQGDWVRALARRLAFDDAEGDDVAQEALVIALHSAEPKRLGAWLAGVVRNLAWKSRRSAARRTRHETAGRTPPASASPAELAARAEAFRDVAVAVAALEPAYRDVVLLQFFDGLPTRDIATRLGLPVETVRTRRKRALALLRGRLDQRHGGRAAWIGLLVPTVEGAQAPAPTAVAVASGAARTTKTALTTLVVTALVVAALTAGAWWINAPDHEDDSRQTATTPTESRPGAEREPRDAAPRPPRRRRRSDSEIVASGEWEDPHASNVPGPITDADAEAFRVLVTDERGNPIARVPIGLTDRAERAHTDERGLWQTHPPIDEATAFASCERAIDGRWYLDAKTTVAPGAADVRLTLRDATLVDGRVVGPEGNPLPLLEIEVIFDGQRACKCNSEDDGVFTARLPSRGRAAVVALTGIRYVRSGGFGGSTAVTTPAPDGEPLPGPSAVSTGGTVAVLQTARPSPWDGRLDDASSDLAPLVLRARPATKDGELDVLIVDVAGNPVPDVRVAASAAGMWIRSTADPRTDAAGRVRLTGLDPRGVRVDPWMDATAAPLDALPPLARVVVPRGQEVTFTFRPALLVAGTVHSLDGAPAGGVRVRAFTQDAAPNVAPLAEADTADDGTFRLLVPIDAPRELRIEARVDAAPDTPVSARADRVVPGTTGLRLELQAR